MSFLFNCCRKSPGKGDFYEVEKIDSLGRITLQSTHDLEAIKNIDQSDRIFRVKKSDYDELMDQHSKTKKWTDPEFPPNNKSLGKIQNVPEDCPWKRLSELLEKPELFDGKIEPSDVIQGSLGDCYFLSAVSALSEVPGRIERVFGNQKFNEAGIYKVQLRVDGIIQQILVDDFIPVNLNDQPLFCQPNKNEFWVLILQKAWAKAHGSYANIASGTPTQVFKAMTCAPSKLQPVKQDENSQEKLWETILEHARENKPCCCGTKTGHNVQMVGLVEGHAYTLIDAANLEDEKGHYHRMLKIRNPWGKRQYKGVGRETDYDFWSRIVESAEKDRFLTGNIQVKNDGIFFMQFNDFCDYFNEVHFCNMIKKPKYEVERLFCDKKHGTIFSFNVKKDADYTIELHQSGIRGEDPERVEEGLNRSTLFVTNDKYELVDGSLKYHEEDNSLTTRFYPGKYYVYAKVDPTYKKGLVPENMSVSCYSSNMVNIVPEDQANHRRFFHKALMPFARSHKRKELENGLMWISWKLLFSKGGFAFVAFGVESSCDKKFIINFEEKDFNDMGYTLKKPFKGKGGQTLTVLPGHEEIIVCRVTNGPLEPMKFPPAIDIQTEKA